MSRDRITWLTVTEFRLLDDWAKDVAEMFRAVPYLVGSVLNDPAYRDVDVRLILNDQSFDDLAGLLSIKRLNFVVSLWGERMTLMDIDFQIQRQTDANDEFAGLRNPIGMTTAEISDE